MVLHCVNCGSMVNALLVQYSPGNTRLTKCTKCKAVADEYIECEMMILLVDLILHKPKAYRHLFFNLPHLNMLNLQVWDFPTSAVFIIDAFTLSSNVVAVKVMDGNKGQGGIQLLLAAEQEAQHIISSARAAKMARLKQAKEEAEREIASYRAQRESEFRKKVVETSGDSGSNVKRLEEETHVKIQHLKSEASKVSPEVVAMLMKYVTTVRN